MIVLIAVKQDMLNNMFNILCETVFNEFIIVNK